MDTPKRSFVDRLNRLEDHFLVFGFAIVIVISFIQVFMRTILNNSLTWSEELVRYIYIWLCWVGVSLTEKRGEHIALTFLTDLFPKSFQKVLAMIVNLVLLLFTAWLVYVGAELVIKLLHTGSVSPALKIPMWAVYLAFPAGNLLFCLRKCGQLVQQVRGVSGKEDMN